MNEPDDQPEINNISFLLFSSGGVRFGVESSQIAAVDPDRSAAGFRIVKLKELLGIPGQSGDDDQSAALAFRIDDGTSFLFIVDMVEDIVEIPLPEIKLLPELIADRVLAKGIWGVFEQNGVVVILLDFHRLLSEIAAAAVDSNIPEQFHQSEGDRI